MSNSCLSIIYLIYETVAWRRPRVLLPTLVESGQKWRDGRSHWQFGVAPFRSLYLYPRKRTSSMLTHLHYYVRISVIPTFSVWFEWAFWFGPSSHHTTYFNPDGFYSPPTMFLASSQVQRFQHSNPTWSMETKPSWSEFGRLEYCLYWMMGLDRSDLPYSGIMSRISQTCPLSDLCQTLLGGYITSLFSVFLLSFFFSLTHTLPRYLW